VGLGLGLILAVIAVTGGLLVFDRALTRWQHPALYPRSSGQGQRAPIEQALASLRAREPGARVQGIILPRDERDALMLFAGPRVFHVDPMTSEILGARPRVNQLMRTLIQLHTNLLIGERGGTVVAVATAASLGLALTGLWLWWPLKIGWFRRGGNFRRMNLDLHSIAGLYTSGFLLVIAITGLTLRYLHGEHPEPPMTEPPPPPRVEITADQAVALAEKALPEARAMSLELPGPNPRAPFRVQLAFPIDGSAAGRSVVFLNKFSGETLAVHSAREGTWLERYQMMQLSLHTGSIFGAPTKWLALLTCVAVLLQIASGVVLWWKKETDDRVRIPSAP
jgi:uncharacterized iron-regulated membrane protein